MVKVEGTDDIFDLVPAPGEIRNEGTFINKATLLKDATADLFGFGADAVPDDVFSKLSGLYLYTWKRRTYEEQITKGGTITISGGGTGNNQSYITVLYSDEVGFDEAGNFGLVNPGQDVVQYTDYNVLSMYVGKYVKFSSSEIIVLKSYKNSYVSNGYWVDMTGERITGEIVYGEWELVTSNEQDLYPETGIADGYEYVYFGVPFENAVTAPAIATGSYTGTGTYGASNPNSLTFDFEPKLVICGIATTGLKPDDTYWSNGFVWYFGTPIQYTGNGKIINMRVDGNTLSWYSSNDMTSQLNYSATAYNYIAIG